MVPRCIAASGGTGGRRASWLEFAESLPPIAWDHVARVSFAVGARSGDSRRSATHRAGFAIVGSKAGRAHGVVHLGPVHASGS